MTKRESELLPGTFDMLILKSLSLGPMHGWGISERIERLSGDIFAVQQGTVYPVLQRLLRRGLITGQWRVTESGRRARFYRLTTTGRRRLDVETAWWDRATAGIGRILHAAAVER